MYGIYVDNEIVLCVPEKLKRGMGDKVWTKVRDAVWAKFGAYDKPDCNPLFSNGQFTHSGKRVYLKKVGIFPCF